MTTNTTPGAGPVTHSPLPWKVNNCGEITDATGPILATVGPDDRSLNQVERGNAKLIIEAVNSHARLLADREKLRKALEAIAPQVGNMLGRLKFSTMDDAKVLPAIRAALEETEGQ